MKIKTLLGIILALAAMTIAGCGGGGGTAAAPTVVSGVASKGPFIAGSVVKVFSIDAATRLKGSQVGAGVTDASGAYSVDISPYTGPILIEVSGSYKDEATGTTVVLDPAAPLRAAVSNAAGSTSVMVTPLTELAVKKIGSVMTNTLIDTKNAEIATAFKVANIITTKPADATATASATAPAAEKDYALVLAAISQLKKDTPDKTLAQLLDGMSTDLNGSVLAETSMLGYKVALLDFIASDKNKAGVTAPPASINPTVLKLAILKISTATVPAGVSIGGLDFTVTLPAGVTVAADATTKQTAPGSIVPSGLAATGTSVSIGTFNAGSLRVLLANSAGLAAGEFVKVACIVAPTSTVTTANLRTAVNLAIPVAKDLTGAALTGVTLTATAEII